MHLRGNLKTAVVILNWNGQGLLQQFLPSVIQFTPADVSVYVADNGSTDNSIEFVKKEFPTVKIIDNGSNLGYSGGYNKALKGLSEDVVILLNSDVEVTANWVEPMIDLMRSNSKIAAVQPKILAYNKKTHFEYAGAAGGHLDKFGYPFCRGRVFDHSEEDNGQYNSDQQIFWATGTCLCINRQAYLDVGGLDEDFFAHMEEIDLCWRLQRAGNEVWAAPSSSIYHVGGGTLNAMNPRKTFLNFRNGLAMLTKNERFSKLLWLIPLRLILDGIAGLKFLIGGTPGHTLAVIKAHFSFYFTFLKWTGKRKGNFKRLDIVVPKSAVWQFYALGKKTYKEIIS